MDGAYTPHPYLASPKEKGAPPGAPRHPSTVTRTPSFRAGDRTRTGDVQLGKLAFYQLNYARDELALAPT